MTASCANLALADHVRYRRFGDEGVVLRQDSAEVLVLNETGIQVLDLAAEGLGPEEIVEAMASNYEVEPTILEAEVNQFLDELLRGGILVQKDMGS